jgi:hypothetical protein
MVTLAHTLLLEVPQVQILVLKVALTRILMLTVTLAHTLLLGVPQVQIPVL